MLRVTSISPTFEMNYTIPFPPYPNPSTFAQYRPVHFIFSQNKSQFASVYFTPQLTFMFREMDWRIWIWGKWTSILRKSFQKWRNGCNPNAYNKPDNGKRSARRLRILQKSFVLLKYKSHLICEIYTVILNK